MNSYTPKNRDQLLKRFSYLAYNNFALIFLNGLIAAFTLGLGYYISTHQTYVEKNPIIISIETNERYAIHADSNPAQWFTLAGVKSYLAQKMQEKESQNFLIWLKSDPTIPYGKILEIIKWLNKQGITRVSLMTENESE